MADIREAVIVEALRSPVGKNRGMLKDWRPDDLIGYIMRSLVDKTQINPHQIDDVIIGCVTQTNEQGLCIARLAVLTARLPVSIPGVTVQRHCSSGHQSLHFAAQGIMAGVKDLVIAGGVESMTRVPLLSDGAEISEKITRYHYIIPQGVSAELVAERWRLTREEVDEFSLRSHKNAARATMEGRFKNEIVPVPVSGDELFTIDEGIRFDPKTGKLTTSMEKLAKLKPAFKKDGGLITAGNSSQISDGAAAMLVCS
ncbi:MAG: thiolase family protein, partial [Candidatus Hodarchaeota archaeon]